MAVLKIHQINPAFRQQYVLGLIVPMTQCLRAIISGLMKTGDYITQNRWRIILPEVQIGRSADPFQTQSIRRNELEQPGQHRQIKAIGIQFAGKGLGIGDDLVIGIDTVHIRYSEPGVSWGRAALVILIKKGRNRRTGLSPGKSEQIPDIIGSQLLE